MAAGPDPDLWEAAVQGFDCRGAAGAHAVLEQATLRGIDVAGVPFRLMDRLLSAGTVEQAVTLADLAVFLKGGQPEVFRALCADLGQGAPESLSDVAANRSLHVKTRWEAICWAVFVRGRAGLPTEGRGQHRIATFWDSGEVPLDLVTPMQDWAELTQNWRCFSDAHAKRFIQRVAGADAARDYDALWHPAVKSDVFRLYWLFDGGGLYVDADSVPRPAVADFLENAGGGLWALSMTRLPHAVTLNGFLAAPRGLSLVAGLIERVRRNLRDHPEGPIFWLSGPGALTTHLWETGAQVHLVPQGIYKDQLFQQVDAEYKRTRANWRVMEQAKGLRDFDWLSRWFADQG